MAVEGISWRGAFFAEAPELEVVRDGAGGRCEVASRWMRAGVRKRSLLSTSSHSDAGGADFSRDWTETLAAGMEEIAVFCLGSAQGGGGYFGVVRAESLERSEGGWVSGHSALGE